jgi:Helix-turn-helix domain
MREKTQKQAILRALKRGPITPMEALRWFGCFRLGARIYELKQDGHDIRADRVTDKSSGKTFASYSLKSLKRSRS